MAIENRIGPNWQSHEIRDMLGREIKLGDVLAKAFTSGHVAMINLCTVTEIRNGKIYLDKSKVPIQFPGRCLLVDGSLVQW